MHNFFKKDDPINLAIAAVSFLVWIITKNSGWAMLVLLLGVIVAQCILWFYPMQKENKKTISFATFGDTNQQRTELPQNFKKMFPSLVGFGWRKVWHGDMVAYAMEVPPQNKLEQVIYDEFHQCLSEQTGQAEFIRRLEPLLNDIGYNICTRYKVRQKRYIPGGKFISSRRLKIIYNTNRNIYQCLYDWIGFCANPDFKMAALKFSSADTYFSDAVFPLVHPFLGFYAPPNQWNNFDRLYFHSELPENYRDFVTPPLEYVEWINKKTGEIIDVPKGIHPGFGQNFFLIYDRLFNGGGLIKEIRLM